MHFCIGYLIIACLPIIRYLQPKEDEAMNLSEFHLSCLKIDFLFCSMLMSSKCKIYRLSKTVNGLDINRQDVHKIYQMITSCHVKLLSDYFLTYFITDLL